MRMLIEAVVRAAHILRTQPGYTMSLTRLHAQLVAELGTAAGTYSEIYQQLQKRTDSFALLNSPRLLMVAESYSATVREEYDAALDQAGLGSVVRVALTEARPDENGSDCAAALGRTIAELAQLCSGDLAMAAYVERATHELAVLGPLLLNAEKGHPTTPLPDPPRAN